MGGVSGPHDGSPLLLLPGSDEVPFPPARLAPSERRKGGIEGDGLFLEEYDLTSLQFQARGFNRTAFFLAG